MTPFYSSVSSMSASTLLGLRQLNRLMSLIASVIFQLEQIQNVCCENQKSPLSQKTSRVSCSMVRSIMTYLHYCVFPTSPFCWTFSLGKGGWGRLSVTLRMGFMYRGETTHLVTEVWEEPPPAFLGRTGENVWPLNFAETPSCQLSINKDTASQWVIWLALIKESTQWHDLYNIMSIRLPHTYTHSYQTFRLLTPSFFLFSISLLIFPLS